MTVRLCRFCGDFHDLNEPWPEKCYGHFPSVSTSSIQVIKDIDPYKTAAADVNGKQVHISGRRQHREFLQRNGYHEIGNEAFKQRAPQIDTVKGHEIRSVIERLNSRRT